MCMPRAGWLLGLALALVAGSFLPGTAGEPSERGCLRWPGDPLESGSPTPVLHDPNIRRAAAQKPDEEKPKPPVRPHLERLRIPPGLPGAEAPPIRLPPLDPKTAKEREKAIERLLRPLPPQVPAYRPAPGPEGRPLTLRDLKQLALNNSPVYRQAFVGVEAARGAAVQVGLYPNPVIGYQGETFPTSHTAGYHGGFIEQLIKVPGKLRLARAAAAMDVANAELNLRWTEADLLAQVRGGYFAVLVAQERARVARIFANLTDEVYQVYVEQVKGGQVAPYEPLELRVLGVQARGTLVEANNRYLTAWRQLAATLGVPVMVPTEVAGNAAMPQPAYDLDRVLAQVLRTHTDVGSAANGVEKARFELRLAEITPVPDMGIHFAALRDYTTPPRGHSFSATAGFAVPLFDRNQGAIRQARANLARAVAEIERVQNDLSARVAEAFERYANSRTLLEYYRDSILPDQVRAYRSLLERYQQEPDKVEFSDVFNAQQTLAVSITTYLGTLRDSWSAIVDLSNLLQQVEPLLPSDGQE